MATCNICGSENAHYINALHQIICGPCSDGTSPKINRESFDTAYWMDDPTVPSAIKREFYADYLASKLSFSEYCTATTNDAI